MKQFSNVFFGQSRIHPFGCICKYYYQKRLCFHHISQILNYGLDVFPHNQKKSYLYHLIVLFIDGCLSKRDPSDQFYCQIRKCITLQTWKAQLSTVNNISLKIKKCFTGLGFSTYISAIHCYASEASLYSASFFNKNVFHDFYVEVFYELAKAIMEAFLKYKLFQKTLFS